MPFGEKSEPGGPRVVDFDAIYEECIKPAAAAAEVETIRADEETLGGIIHRPMYERLLLAEIVVADLTFANANVFYELGVRHAARPRSTILIYAKVNQLPFDVGLIRAIPYELDAAGALIDAPALRNTLVERLRQAMTDEAVDSPLFQLLDDYPGISLAHDVTEAFRERAIWASDLTIRANNAVKSSADRAEAREELLGIEREASALAGSEGQIMVMLMLAYRDISEWDDMIRVAESLPSRLRSIPTIREQMAMALSRRNRSEDRNRAIEIIEEVITKHGESPESLGILGRCYKARWDEKRTAGDPGAQDALAQAIDAYGRGFDADPRDFYPGVNLVTLLAHRGEAADIERLRKVAPVVNFAAARKGGLRSRDYWVLATVLETSSVTGEEEIGRRALSAMLDANPAPWMCETTADNLDILIEALPALGQSIDWVSDVASTLRKGEAVS
jgi:hypothetical protein